MEIPLFLVMDCSDAGAVMRFPLGTNLDLPHFV
jgi:hypothetical protein